MNKPFKIKYVNKKDYKGKENLHMIGINLAQEMIYKELKCSLNEIKFSKTKNGKPVLVGNKLYFNISHSNEVVICAISKFPIGIDIEYVKKKRGFLNIAKNYFHLNEYEFLKSIALDKLPNMFYKMWTLKEAYLKMKGKTIGGHISKIPKINENMKFNNKNLKSFYVNNITDYECFVVINKKSS